MNITKQLITLALCLTPLFSLAQTPIETNTAPPKHRSVHFALGLGLGYGGDDVAKLEYTNGNSSKIKAGGGLSYDAGILITPKDSKFQYQISYGVQTDSDNAENADISFERNRLEILAFYQFKHNQRFGIGFAKHSGIEFDFDFEDAKINQDYDDANAMILQWDFITVNKTKGSVGNIGLRYVDVEYEPENRFVIDGLSVYEMKTLDGSHFALTLGFAF